MRQRFASIHLSIAASVSLWACSAAPRPAPVASPAPAPAPVAMTDTPAREEIVSAMGALYPRLLACSESHGANLSLRFVFASNGTVESVAMREGTYPDGLPVVGTPAENCMLEAARTAHVRAFRQAHYELDYAYRIAEQLPALHCVEPPPAGSVGAPHINVPGVVHGVLDASDHVLSDASAYDDYLLTLAAGQTVTIVVRGEASTSTPGSNLDMYTFLLCGDREATHDDDSAGGTNSRIIVTAAEAGIFTLRINTYGAGLKTGAYTIETWNGAEPTAE